MHSRGSFCKYVVTETRSRDPLYVPLGIEREKGGNQKCIGTAGKQSQGSGTGEGRLTSANREAGATGGDKGCGRKPLRSGVSGSSWDCWILPCRRSRLLWRSRSRPRGGFLNSSTSPWHKVRIRFCSAVPVCVLVLYISKIVQEHARDYRTSLIC
jgi:hypothetical protein